MITLKDLYALERKERNTQNSVTILLQGVSSLNAFYVWVEQTKNLLFSFRLLQETPIGSWNRKEKKRIAKSSFFSFPFFSLPLRHRSAVHDGGRRLRQNSVVVHDAFFQIATTKKWLVCNLPLHRREQLKPAQRTRLLFLLLLR